MHNTRPREESGSPLAFSHSSHQQTGILEVFFMLTFRPRDSHCIHVDPKASESTKRAIEAVIKCYKHKYPEASIFMAADPVPVYWGHFSVLEVRHFT